METPFNTIAYTEKYVADQQAKDITDVIAKRIHLFFQLALTA